MSDGEHRLATLVEWTAWPTVELGHAFSRDEFRLRVHRARELMAEAGLDALVLTSSSGGSYFTGDEESHEWHDRCLTRASWYILTPDADYHYLNPGMGGEHLNTARRATWVTNLRPTTERYPWPRHEIWDVHEFAVVLSELGLGSARLGWELGDCTMLGLTYLDFERLRGLLPAATFADGAPVMRRLRQVHTPEEIERVRKACRAAVSMHDLVPEIVRPGMMEAALCRELEARFAALYGHDSGYRFRGTGGWDARNPATRSWSFVHRGATDRPFQVGDFLARNTGATTYRGYPGDVDRSWYIGMPPPHVVRWYAATRDCLREMAAAIRPGNTCADVYRAYELASRRHGMPERRYGRQGHGISNAGGISVHPSCHLVLEPGMIISCEPVFVSDHGLFDLEDQFVVTETGAECLHPPAPDDLPLVTA